MPRSEPSKPKKTFKKSTAILQSPASSQSLAGTGWMARDDALELLVQTASSLHLRPISGSMADSTGHPEADELSGTDKIDPLPLGDFDPVRSEVDVLAEFHPEALGQLGMEYFGDGEDLPWVLGARVDFCSKLNRHIARSVREEVLPIYDQACPSSHTGPTRSGCGKSGVPVCG